MDANNFRATVLGNQDDSRSTAPDFHQAPPSAPGPRRQQDANANSSITVLRSPTTSAPFLSPTSKNSHDLFSSSAPSPNLAPPTRLPPPPTGSNSFNTSASSHFNPSQSSPSSTVPSRTSGLPPLAPPQGALGSIMVSPRMNGASASPLQAPHTSDYHHAPREKTSGSFYDPLTDTTDDRRPSDLWSSKQVRRTLSNFVRRSVLASRFTLVLEGTFFASKICSVEPQRGLTIECSLRSGRSRVALT